MATTPTPSEAPTAAPAARARRIAIAAGFAEDPDIRTWLFVRLRRWCAMFPIVDGFVAGVAAEASAAFNVVADKALACEMFPAIKAYCDTVPVWDCYAWVKNEADCPSNEFLSHFLVVSPMQAIFSVTCFLVAALGTGTDADDPDGNKRYRAFRASFDVLLGYSAGEPALGAISKADNLEKLLVVLSQTARSEIETCLFLNKLHTQRWGKENMVKSWLCTVKGPAPVLEKTLATINAEFPDSPLFAAMKLTPMLTVVGGHPTPLAKLKTIMPEQAKLLPIHDAFHSPFYQEDGMTQFIKEKIALGRHEVWAPVPDSPAFISSFRQADISMIEAAEFFEQMQRDGIQNSINWPACTKAAVTVNGGCKAVELYDLGPTGIAFLTHNLCAQMFALKSTLINCVNTHDPDKKRAAVTTSEPTPPPKPATTEPTPTPTTEGH